MLIRVLSVGAEHMWYGPVVFLLALPMFFMQGTIRTVVAAALLAWGAYALWKRKRGGWQLKAVDDHFAEIKG